jgi:hypothetical protein
MPYVPPGGGSSGGSGTTRKSKPKQDVFKTAAKLLQIKNPKERARAEKAVGKVLRGLSGEDITRIGRRAGLDPADVQAIAATVGSDYVKQGAPDWGAVAWPIDLLDRVTGRPIRRGLVKGKGGRDPLGMVTGAYEGLVEGKSSPGTQAVIALASGKGEKETGKVYRDLPGAVRVGGDIVSETALDPTTYLTFGVSAIAEGAARTAAKKIAGDAAQHAALSPQATTVYKRILAHGKKGLTKDELAELPGAIRRRLNRNKGGARVAGLQVPGTQGAFRTLGPKKADGLLSALERKLRTQGAARQAERRGDFLPGTTRSVENVTAQVKGGKYLANLKPREYEKAAAAISKHFGEDDLDVVREALDLAGGRGAIDAIPDGPAKALAVKLREMSAEDFETALDLGRLQPDVKLAAAHRQEEMFGDNIDLMPPTQQDTYYPGIRTPDAIAEGGEGVRRAAGDTTGRMPGYTQARTRTGPASEYQTGTGSPYYELDPIVAFGKHSKDVALDKTYVEAWQELQRIPGPGKDPMVVTFKPGDDVATVKANNPERYAEYEVVKRPVTRDVDGELRTLDEQILVHSTIKKDFEKVMDLTERGADTQKILDFVDNVNAVWASYATATPGFVARNVVQGNFFMGGVLAGAANPAVWAHQMNVMRLIAKGIRQHGNPFALVKPADRHVVEQAIKNHIVDSSFIQSIEDLGDEATKRAVATQWVRRNRLSPASVNFAPLKGIRDINKFFENWSRLSVFANKMKQGFAPPEAGFITRKYMIDYTDLSPANEALKHASPFLTWTYKSVPMILGTLAKDPRKITIPLHITGGIHREGMRSENASVLPQWMVDSGGMMLPKDVRERLPGSFGDAPQTVIGADPIHSTLDTLSGVQHLADAARGIPGVPGEPSPGALEEFARQTINSLGLGGSLGGMIQWGMETAAGKEFFSGRKYEPGTQVPVPGILQPVLGKTLDWAQYRALTTAFPIIARMELVSPGSDYAEEVQPRRQLASLAGIQAYPVGPTQVRGEFYRRREILNALLNDVRRRGKLPETGSSGGSGGYVPPGG